MIGPASPVLESWVVGLALAGSGFTLLIGFLTPFASAAIALITTAVAVALVPPPARDLFHPSLAEALVVVVAASLAFLGPGSLSVDCRLYGRREIIIPQTRPSQKGH